MIMALGSIPKFMFHFLMNLPQGGKLCSRPLFNFITSLPQRIETMLKTFVSFFNNISTENKIYAQGVGFNPHIFVSFFNELAT
jgi:hypothetical protein